MADFNFNDARNMKIPDLLTNPGFKSHYVTLYDRCHPRSHFGGAHHFDHEVSFFRKLFMDNPEIQQATALSVAMTFIDLAYYGVTIEPMPKTLAYVLPRPQNIGSKQNPVWEKRVYLKISPYGELILRKNSQVIADIEGPTIVYEGDGIEIVNNKVTHRQKLSSPVITGAWIGIIKHGGSREDKYFSIEQIQSYRAKSKDKDSYAWTGGVNGQPTRGMIEAKVILHAFDTYPRLNLSKNTELMSESEVFVDPEAAYATTVAQLSQPGSNSQGDGEEDYPVEEVQATEVPAVPDPWQAPNKVAQEPQHTTAAVEVTKPKAGSDNVPTFF